MQRLLFAWLPLLVAVLLLLRGYAAILGPSPKQPSGAGESKLTERSISSKRSMGATVIIVAVVMSAFLGLLALMFALLPEEFRVPQWVAYLIYGFCAVFGLLLVGSQLILLAQLFKSMWVRVVVCAYAVVTVVAWLLWPNWLTVDLLAMVWALVALCSYMQLTLNFKAVAVIGAGFFVYDIVNVYFTGNMQRVAEPVLEAQLPALVVVPQSFSLDAPRAAALGMGDIILPGLLIMLAAVVAYRHNAMRLLYGALAGYAVGLILIFGVLFVTRHSQPALITLYPCVLIAILLMARREGVMHELLSMRHKKAPPKKEDSGCTCGGDHTPAPA